MAQSRKNKPGSAAPDGKKETLKEMYARLKREFTAADLQKYTVIEKGIPLETVIAEMEAIHRTYKKKQTR